MSRRKTQDELDAEAEAADARKAKLHRAQRECVHWRCAPAEWYWSGQIRVMRCDECGAENYLEEAES